MIIMIMAVLREQVAHELMILAAAREHVAHDLVILVVPREQPTSAVFFCS